MIWQKYRKFVVTLLNNFSARNSSRINDVTTNITDVVPTTTTNIDITTRTNAKYWNKILK